MTNSKLYNYVFYNCTHNVHSDPVADWLVCAKCSEAYFAKENFELKIQIKEWREINDTCVKRNISLQGQVAELQVAGRALMGNDQDHAEAELEAAERERDEWHAQHENALACWRGDLAAVVAAWRQATGCDTPEDVRNVIEQLDRMAAELARLRELEVASEEVCVPNADHNGCGCPTRFYQAREACRAARKPEGR